MGRKKMWIEERECFCGKTFTTIWSNQRYCCEDHALAARKAKVSRMGRKMLDENPEMVVEYYG